MPVSAVQTISASNISLSTLPEPPTANSTYPWNTASYRNLVKALVGFEGAKIDCLYVDDVDAIPNEPDIIPHLGHSTHTLACRNPPTPDKPNIPRAPGILLALDPKLTLHVPQPSVPFSEQVIDILDLRYLSDYALGDVFRHGVQGHQHQRVLSHLLQGRRL